MPNYALQIGPLAFTGPSENLGKTLGDALESVGAAIVPTERKPRPLKLKLTVEGDPREPDPVAVGDRLRRQVEQLLENRRWLRSGLYVRWTVKDLLAGWVMLGGGDLTETDPGVTFGRYDLELSDLYIVGNPGTHRVGRRLDLADRRGGTVPRDTRGRVYSVDFADTPALAHPLVLPGDAYNGVASSRLARGVVHGATLPRASGGYGVVPSLWQAWEAQDGEVVTYMPHPDLHPDPLIAPTHLDELGSVRVWDTNLPAAGGNITADPFTDVGDVDPTGYGWERVYGAQGRADRYLAIENGTVRARWLGAGTPDQGLALEWWDQAAGRYRLQGQLIHTPGETLGNAAAEITVVELTPERGVIQVAIGPAILRVILQRGWVSARIESYVDLPTATQAAAVIFTRPGADTGAVSAVTAPAWVKSIAYTTDTTTEATLVAPAEASYSWTDGYVGPFSPIDTLIAATAPNNTVALQIAPPRPDNVLLDPVELAAVSLVDARSIPVLVSR